MFHDELDQISLISYEEISEVKYYERWYSE